MPQIGQFTAARVPHRRGAFCDIHARAGNIAIVPAEALGTRATCRTTASIDGDPASGDIGPESRRGLEAATGERAPASILSRWCSTDPALPQPIRANLFRDDDAGNARSLHWSRSTRSRREGFRARMPTAPFTDEPFECIRAASCGPAGFSPFRPCHRSVIRRPIRICVKLSRRTGLGTATLCRPYH